MWWGEKKKASRQFYSPLINGLGCNLQTACVLGIIFFISSVLPLLIRQGQRRDGHCRRHGYRGWVVQAGPGQVCWEERTVSRGFGESH